MLAYLYLGTNREKDLVHLATTVAGLRLPILVIHFGPPGIHHPLAAHTAALPIDLVPVHLPGLGLPRGPAPADELLIQTALTVLRQMIGRGDYRLVILDQVRQAVGRGILTVADLQHLIQAAPAGTEMAMT